MAGSVISPQSERGRRDEVSEDMHGRQLEMGQEQEHGPGWYAKGLTCTNATTGSLGNIFNKSLILAIRGLR